MRVLHLFSGKEMGGISGVVLPLLEALMDRGHSVTALFLQTGRLLETARQRGIEVSLIERKGTLDTTAIRRIAAHVRQRRYDIVHSHSVAGNLYGRLACMLAGPIPLVTSVHADTWQEISDSTRSALKARLWFHADIIMNRFSDVIVPNSRYVEDMLIRRGVPPAKLRTIHNGIPLAAPEDFDSKRAALAFPGIRPSSAVVGTVGRFTDSKNQELLLQAAPLVLERIPGVCFLLVGDGTNRTRLHEVSRELGVAQRVVFTGWTDDVYSYISAMDVFVLPSRHEAFGIALLEAMSLAKPVVATRTGGIPEVVEEGVSGLLATSENASEMAENIVLLLENPDRAREMGQRGREVLEREFTLPKMADKVESLYGTLTMKG
jgi:glycosyltransferase involved in cell wall biosynthesis